MPPLYGYTSISAGPEYLELDSFQKKNIKKEI